MKISYSMLVHNEDKTLEKLLKFLVKWKHEDDEIVILDDYSDNEKTKQILDFYLDNQEELDNWNKGGGKEQTILNYHLVNLITLQEREKIEEEYIFNQTELV